MGITRRLVPLALFAAFGLPAAASAGCTSDYLAVDGYTYKAYPEIRQDSDESDGSNAPNDAIALLSNSSLHGTFNRFSALLTRPQTKDLAPDTTSRTALPTNFKRGYSLALADLDSDLSAAWSDLDADPSTTLADRSVFLQLASFVALERGLQWYDDYVGLSCGASEPVPGFQCTGLDDEDRQLLDDLELVPPTVAETLLEIVGLAVAEAPFSDYLSNCINTLDADQISSRELVNAVNELRRVTGEPIIDYDWWTRVTGVPSIDD